MFVDKWDLSLEWFFHNESTSSLSETPAFKTKSSWNPPKGHLCLEVYLSQVEKELFELAVSHLGTGRSLADYRSIIIKNADKGSCIVVWDRNYYIVESETTGIKIYTRTLILMTEFYGIW